MSDAEKKIETLGENLMLPPRPQPIRQRACDHCDLMTPSWRKQCIHCGKQAEAAVPSMVHVRQQQPAENHAS